MEKFQSPIFIIGCGRSGTSLLCWILGQHSNLIALPETEFLFHYAHSLGSVYRVEGQRNDSILKSWNIDFKNFIQGHAYGVQQFIHSNFWSLVNSRDAAFLDSVHSENDTNHLSICLIRSWNDPKKRWVNATPRLTYATSILHEMFPEAKFIFLIRHPLEVIHSFESFSRNGPGFENVPHFTFDTALQEWMVSNKSSLLLEGILGENRVRRYFFSDLIQDPQSFLQSICHFIGEIFHPHMLLPLTEKINASINPLTEERKRLIKLTPGYDEAVHFYQRLKLGMTDFFETKEEMLEKLIAMEKQHLIDHGLKF